MFDSWTRTWIALYTNDRVVGLDKSAITIRCETVVFTVFLCASFTPTFTVCIS